MTVPLISTNTYETFVLDAVLSGRIAGFELPGGEIGWAAGAQYRTNGVKNEYGPYNNLTVNPCIDSVTDPTATCAIPQGSLNFSPSATPVDLEQKVKAVFVELSLPVTEALNVQLAARYEDYGGGTGSTTNPKLAVKWQLTPELALRGSIGTTFRGPTALNVDPNKSTTLNPVTAAGGTSKGIDYYGNPNLKPETALNTNVGLLFARGPITASVDYWRFDFKDSIVAPPYDAIATSVVPTPNGLANCSAPLRSLIIFDNGDACAQGVTTGANILRVRADLINGADVNTSGVDFDVNFDMGEVWGGGNLTLGASGSYLIEYVVGPTFANGVQVLGGYDGAGFLNDDRGGNSLPRFKAYFRADYALGPHNIGAGVRYVASYLDNRTAIFTAASPLGKKIDETFQLDANYRLQLETATLTLSVENVFDTAPSFARTAYSYDTFTGNPLGRVFKVGVRKTF